MCLRKDSLCYFNTCIFPMFFFMFSPCRRRTAGRPPFTAKIRMVCPLKALHCTSVSPPCRNILPNRLFCCWKRLIFVEGIKKERPASFYLLSALETVPEIAVRSAILFSGGISPSPSLCRPRILPIPQYGIYPFHPPLKTIKRRLSFCNTGRRFCVRLRLIYRCAFWKLCRVCLWHTALPVLNLRETGFYSAASL